MSRKWIPGAAIAASLAALALGIAAPTTALAHFVKAPCDFITSGGFVFKDDGKDVNFGAHGGCKNDDFWGHVNIVDHETNWHLSSTQITGYLFDPANPNARDIIKKHERTRQDKEDDRTRLIGTLRADTGPVFLTYRDRPPIDAIVSREMGIPSIVALTGVTRWLHDGDLVELDGSTGIVVRLEEV